MLLRCLLADVTAKLRHFLIKEPSNPQWARRFLPRGDFCGLVKFRQKLSTFTLSLGVVFLRILHRQALGNETSRIAGSSHLRVDSSKFDVVHEAIRIEFDRLLEARDP